MFEVKGMVTVAQLMTCAPNSTVMQVDVIHGFSYDPGTETLTTYTSTDGEILNREFFAPGFDVELAKSKFC